MKKYDYEFEVLPDLKQLFIQAFGNEVFDALQNTIPKNVKYKGVDYDDATCDVILVRDVKNDK